MSHRARQFNYMLRPSKQVERRLIVQFLHGLRDAGYDVSSYRYVGFGSIYYADFLTVHRYLYVDDMLCLESADIPKSMAFNKPYGFIDLDMRAVADVVPDLDRTRRHIVWLDYDYDLKEPVLLDIASLATTLAVGSVLIVTVKAAPPFVGLEGEPPDGELVRRQAVADRITSDLGDLATPITVTDLTKPRLARILANAITEHVQREVARRSDGLKFYQSFSYRYADGLPMVTVGGVLEAGTGLSALQAKAIEGWRYAQPDQGAAPVEIAVPWLTQREKFWLDERVKTMPDEMEFELDGDDLAGFVRYYREYPAYAEVLL